MPYGGRRRFRGQTVAEYASTRSSASAWAAAAAKASSASNSTIGQTGLALGQTYDSRDEALATVQRISGWKIADAGELDADQRYTVSLRFRLDTSQLPRPFQIGAVGSADWNLAAARNQRLDSQK